MSYLEDRWEKPATTTNETLAGVADRLTAGQLAPLGAGIGVGEIAHGGVEAVEQANNQRPAGVVPCPLDIAHLTLGGAGRGAELDLLEPLGFAQCPQCEAEVNQGIGRVVVVGARQGRYTLPGAQASYLAKERSRLSAALNTATYSDKA
jgi:hypothetical protein